jgi:myo-inositol-1-phosphate synthase
VVPSVSDPAPSPGPTRATGDEPELADLPAPSIAPAEGTLGVVCVGLGAVATTFIAGVELIRRGMAEPVGSLTQMGTVRLGKRTEDRVPLIRDFVPLAALDQLAFGAWDPFPDDAYISAVKAGVLDVARHLEPIAESLREIQPMPAAFDPAYVKKLDGPTSRGTRASGPSSRASATTCAPSVSGTAATGW